MGFFNFRGKKNDGQKKKTDSVKKQVMQVFNPKKAAAAYFTEPKKKRVIVTLKKNLVKNNLEVICHAIFYSFKAWSEKG